jgi:twinkle protein
MSQIIEQHVPCPCGKSSDAYCIYDDHEHCYSCGKHTKLNDFPPIPTAAPPLDENVTFEYLAWRGITRETMAHYKVKTKIDSAGQPYSLGFPYGDDTFKVRTIADKKFTFVPAGKPAKDTLFGLPYFSAGQSRSITVTEGELDALSAFQMLGSKFPVVSVRGASSAKKDCATARDYLNSFDRIYLCFDNDEPGQKAVKDVASLFDFNKIYHVKMSRFKDANEYLTNDAQEEFKSIWFNSKRFLPEGIISSFSEFDAILDQDDTKESITYPFPTLQRMTYGIRPGECTLFTALEGVGKTEVIRAIEVNLCRTTDHNVGIIHLEENERRILKGMANYELLVPCHLPDSNVPKEDIKAAYRKVFGRDDRVHAYGHFGSDDPEAIIDKIRFLVSACDCRYVFLDHITMVVTGLADQEQNKALDYLSTKLAMMVEDLNFGLVFISHVNDEGLTRGSRNISKVAHTWVHMDRNITAETEQQRNMTHLTLKKNRFAGRTGPAGKLLFDQSTFTIKEVTEGDLPF